MPYALSERRAQFFWDRIAPKYARKPIADMAAYERKPIACWRSVVGQAGLRCGSQPPSPMSQRPTYPPA